MGLRNITRSSKEWEDDFQLNFHDESTGGGYAFDMVESPQGFSLKPLGEGQQQSFEYALSRPWDMIKIVNWGRWTRNPAHGTCLCGQEVWLEADYGHGINCDGCERIYNQSGAELAPRSQWEDRYSEDTGEPGSYDSTQPYCIEFGYIGPGDEY